MRSLIVDDSMTNAKMLKSFLSPFGECDIVTNGKEAIEVYNNSLESDNLYHLICLDIMMPEMNGQIALVKLRQIEDEKKILNHDRVKIIMVSGAPLRENLINAFKGRCDAYLPKPFSKNGLFRHLYSLELVDPDTLIKNLLNIKITK